MLSKEVEAVLNVRNDRFLLREGESPLFHECFDERLNLLFEKLFGSSCYDKVISVPCQIDFGAVPLLRAREPFQQLLAQTVQGRVRDRG